MTDEERLKSPKTDRVVRVFISSTFRGDIVTINNIKQTRIPYFYCLGVW
jgi:hypothetical protein